jgi:predicted chitinase
MRASEFVTEQYAHDPTVDEGLKGTIAGLGLAAAAASGVVSQYMPKPTVSAPPAVTQSTIQPAPDTPESRLKSAAQTAGLAGTELAQFMAQCAHETANFARMSEQGTAKYFAKKYENPRARRILGNTQAGDGERFRGRGYIQLTGRDNYTRAGRALRLPLDTNPDLAARPDVAAKIALWYWKNRVAPKIDNFSNTAAASHAINPRGRHVDRRQQQFAQYAQSGS